MYKNISRFLKAIMIINKKLTLQLRALILLIIFLILMAVLNVISKNADNIITPQVTVTSLEETTIDEVEYFRCIPLDAIHNDGQKDFVLIVSEKETVLGKVMIAERREVKLESKNDKWAALDDTLDRSQDIILKSDKAVEDGDRVKVKD